MKTDIVLYTDIDHNVCFVKFYNDVDHNVIVYVYIQSIKILIYVSFNFLLFVTVHIYIH